MTTINHKLTSIILILLAVSSNSQMSQTKWTDPNTNTKYDFTKLQRKPDKPWEVIEDDSSSYYKMKYYINFGIPNSKRCHDRDSAVTEVLTINNEDTSTCEILGQSDKVEVQLIDPSNKYSGIMVTYSGGDNCNKMEDDYTWNSDPRKSTFRIYCAKKQSSNFIIDHPGNVQGSTKCNLYFKIDSPAGCPGGYYSRISATLILVIFIVGFAIYVGAGIVYNKKKKGLEGKEAIPNIEFWRQFPTYVSLGLKFIFGWIGGIVGKFKRKGGNEGDKDNYTDI